MAASDWPRTEINLAAVWGILLGQNRMREKHQESDVDGLAQVGKDLGSILEAKLTGFEGVSKERRNQG